ncbi:MAG: aminotransferase class I/II-fold pyridoxal phosphate-dependent enzyme [Vicinamibacterales bacterium]
MKIEPFEMERWQSTWENEVACNLSESGVHPLRVEDLVDSGQAAELLRQELGYPQTNGTRALREAIAALYPGAAAANIEVTNGGAEANFVVAWRFLEPGDEAVMMVPNYMQLRGLARAFAGKLHEWPLVASYEAGRWRADLDHLARLVTGRTKLILICNPNNPTGARLDSATLDEICRIAGRHGAWVVADEIYRGAELDGEETPTVWGRYERALVTCGLSKAYGLPGLRIGWVVAPPEVADATWMYHDYTTIAPSALSDRLATIALSRASRPKILDRTRSILRANLPVIRAWLDRRPDVFRLIPPEAGAIVYPSYNLPINSTALAERLRRDESLLVVPGDQFGMDGYLRIGYGGTVGQLQGGLDRLDRVVRTLAGV